MLRYLPVLLVVAFSVYAAVDAVQQPDERVRHFPKLVWVVLIMLFPPLGGLVWFLAGRDRPGIGPGRRQPPPAGPRGPDDDPDFLRGL
ncbi:MAG: PLD nuclease N-terminal domain-containing protein [Micrococcales bacterium]|nr:PLD nuclease N-terminal domain-containing protein [Micrococcales bacterium]